MIDYGLKYEQLEGRRFTEIGDKDCYALCMDFFNDNFGIKLTNYARPADWQSAHTDLIRNLYERDGFEMITEWKAKDLRPADVLALMISEPNPNHLAIYLGNDEIIHHLYRKLSRREPFSGVWRNHTAFILRHPDVPDLRPPVETQDLAEFISARNAPPTP